MDDAISLEAISEEVVDAISASDATEDGRSEVETLREFLIDEVMTIADSGTFVVSVP